MQPISIGEYIRQRRLDMGLSQKELSENICESSTLSRIENGVQTPSRPVINALLERLGLPTDRYIMLLGNNEIEVLKLQKEIVSCNVHHKKEEGLKKLEELEAITKKEDNLIHQFILRSKVLLGEYTPEEKLQMLTKAIHMTVPRFDLDEIDRFIYTIEDVKIINQIALVYSEMGNHDKAVDIYRQLLKYIKKRYPDMISSGGYLPMVAFNYARELDLCGHYKDALKIADQGHDFCIEYGHYQFLPDILSIKAECHHFLGDDIASKELYILAYNNYIAIKNFNDATKVKKEAKEYLGVEL